MWLIPPHFALWIPSLTQHRVRMPGAVSMRTLYFRPGLVSTLLQSCALLNVSPLLRELIVEAARIGRLRMRNHLECALRDLTISHIEKSSRVSISVTLPKESRALAVSEAVLNDPAQTQKLASLCADVGVSVRTVQRLFRKEIGMDFETWRRQVRLIKAVELLVSGRSVKETAFAIGYRQSSAFVEAFRQTFGMAPKSWLASIEDHGRRRGVGGLNICRR